LKPKEELADRNFFLGDPDYVKMPLKQLMDDTYLKKQNG
jgi:gamma-glutamyltranspeptidase/glutathione hydrolase